MSGESLVVQSPTGRRMGLIFVVAMTILAVGTATRILMERGQLPGGDLLPEPVHRMLVIALTMTVTLVLMRRTRHQGIHAELSANGVRLRGLSVAYDVSVLWSDIAGYRDDEAELVLLVHRRGIHGPSPLVVPTPTEKDRVAVLAFLDRQGLRRVGE